MRRKRRRAMQYYATTLRDGTVFGVFPIRKPSARVLKRDHLRIDPDGVTIEYSGSGLELADFRNETRFRFQDIIATSLNTRRAIRGLVLPEFAALMGEVRRLHERLDKMEKSNAPGR